jgi:hypothetical protein
MNFAVLRIWDMYAGSRALSFFHPESGQKEKKEKKKLNLLSYLES